MNNILRTICQKIFGISIFEFPVIRIFRMKMYEYIFNIEKPKYISNHVLLFCKNGQGLKADDCIEIKENIGISAGVRVDYTNGVKIGKNVWLSEGCKIYTSDFYCSPIEKEMKSGLEIGDYAWIGANAIVLPSVSRIGNNSIIGAGGVVTQDIPDNALVVGNPAFVIRLLKEHEMIKEDYKG